MRRFLVACAAVALLGCGGDSTGPAASAEGTWNLQTVGGSALPYTAIFIASPMYRLEILSDQLITNSDGTYSETAQIRETDGSTVSTSSEQDTGKWSQHGSQVSFTSDADGAVINAAVSGNQLSFSTSGGAAIYARQ